MRLRVTSALSALFLTLLLTSCAKQQQTVYQAVKVPYLPISPQLLTECPAPRIPQGMTWEDSLLLNIQLLTLLGNCNAQLKAIEQIDNSRQESSNK